MTNEEAYQLISKVAAPSEREGLKKERAILLLWFLRNVFGIDDLEAYEYICDGNNDQGVDGLYLEQDSEGQETLVIFQSKYPTTAKNVGENEVRSFVGAVAPFKTEEGLKGMLQGNLEKELHALITRFRVEEKVKQGELKFRLVLVVAGQLTNEARSLVNATNQVEGTGYLTVYDSIRLGPIIEAFRSPETVKAQIEMNVPSSKRFTIQSSDAKITIGAVKVGEIVQWPGIDDRTLYHLNVRRELPRNKVRKALDKAIKKTADHPNFLAFHNGLTVVCEKIDDSDSDKLTITNMSVVNGAQSSIAFKANEEHVTDKLEVTVKFVEVEPESQIAREVASRSNTQNPVNPRNLRSLDGIQLRLKEEFKQSFPSITYETSPDRSNASTGHVIQNDDAAQLLTAIFHEKPWLAVKRQALFEAATYPAIFTERITAAHIVLADLISEQVQKNKDRFPSEYQRSWQLTKLVACYIVGQLLRADDEDKVFLENPSEALEKTDLNDTLNRLARSSAVALKVRNDSKSQDKEFDNFKVDFKNEDVLRSIRTKARELYLMQQALAE